MSEITRILKRSNAFDDRRSRYLTYASWIVLPALLFPLGDSQDAPITILSLFGIGLLITVNIAVVRKNWHWGKANLPSISIVYAMLCCWFFTYLGEGEGGSASWIYVFPAIAIYLRGLTWGAISCLVAVSGNVYLMTFGASFGGFEYPSGVAARSTLSLLLLATLTLGFEFWRISIELEKESLHEKLKNTRTALAKYVGVCAWCNTIRGEEGNWYSIEDHLQKTENQFVTHTICDACAINEFGPDS